MPDKKDTLTKLPKLSEWKAPWEVDKDTGVDIPEEEQKIDPAQLKRYLHGLLSDKLTLRANLTETTTRVEELEQKVTDATDPKQIEKLQEDLATARQERDDAKKNATNDAEVLKYRVALRKGLTEVQAKRLVGTTEEELEEDAEELLSSFGASGKSGDGDKNDSADDIRSAPRRNLNNSGDPAPGSKSEKKDDEDPEKVYEKWLATQ